MSLREESLGDSYLALSPCGTVEGRCWIGDTVPEKRKGTHKFALKAGVGKPFDANSVADLYGRVLSVLADSNDLADPLMTTDQGAVGESTQRYRGWESVNERDTGNRPIILLHVQI